MVAMGHASPARSLGELLGASVLGRSVGLHNTAQYSTYRQTVQYRRTLFAFGTLDGSELGFDGLFLGTLLVLGHVWPLLFFGLSGVFPFPW